MPYAENLFSDNVLTFGGFGSGNVSGFGTSASSRGSEHDIPDRYGSISGAGPFIANFKGPCLGQLLKDPKTGEFRLSANPQTP